MEAWLALHHLLNIKSAHGRLNRSVVAKLQVRIPRNPKENMVVEMKTQQ